jgi:omega-6 fatty acid desaturase (delta-12 desaturase)
MNSIKVEPAPAASAVAQLHNSWKEIVAKYQVPSTRRAIWQVLNTLIPYLAVWLLIRFTKDISLWLTLPLALLGGGLMVRMFIIFHDCGHGSFFSSRRANDVLGSIAGVLTFTPYFHWRWEHSIHHATSGDLDRRGVGDVWTMTVDEYLKASKGKRLAYRLTRNPFVLFVLGPAFLFLFRERFPTRTAPRRERWSVYATNAGILLFGFAMSWLIGFKLYLMCQLAMILIAGSAGVWLFYVQHQFEGVYWERRENWDYCLAALEGSSFYKLPKVLQWFSGNIGFHHIHHLSPRIPNYNLERCHRAEPLFQQIKPVTLLSSLKCVHFRLWDEQRRRLVGFGILREIRRQARGQSPGFTA